jgi:hypothetical protein
MDETSKNPFGNLPNCAADYIRLIIKKMRWQKKARLDVQNELIAHFEDALNGCKTNEEKEKTAKELISNFGDAKLIAVLARRAKKRCRPLWQKVLIHSLQILGIIIIYLAICGVYLSSGKPTISVNYVEWLNNYVRQGRDESLNSAPMLKKAAELSIDEPNWLKESKAKWPSDFNEFQLKGLGNWLAQNNQAFETLRKALDKPYYWSIYDTNESDFVKGELFGGLMKTLSIHRSLAKAMNWKIRYAAYKNNTEEAINDVISLCGFGHRIQGNGLLIEQLVGIAIEAIGYSTAFDIMSKNDLSVQQLENLQNFFQQGRDDDVINIEAEKVCLYDFVQRNFTDDGKGGGKPVRQGVGLAGKSSLQIILNMVTFNLPNKKEVIEQIDNIYDTCQQRFESPDFESTKEKFNQEIHDAPMMLQITIPAFDKVNELSWRVKTHRDGLIATLAVLRYKQQTGKYPQSLDELLKTGFINRMPFDMYRNGPLTYRQTDTGFTLYSYGKDRDDDKGKMGIDEGKPNMWNADDGDAVFWPVTHPAKKDVSDRK